MTRKPRILWMSDSPLLPTGYSNITVNVCNRLAAAGWDVHVMGHNYLGQTIGPGIPFEDGNKLDFKLWSRGREDWCKDIIVERIRELKPDVFGILLDTFMVFPWFPALDLAPAKTFFYYPSDGGGGIPHGCETILQKVHLPIAMSKFGQQQVKDNHGINAACIQHGVDTKHFKPGTKKQVLLAKKRFGLVGKYVVGVVARNQNRKMLDRTFKAFAKWCPKHPDAVLLMHTDPGDVAASFDMTLLINRLQINNRVFFTGTKYTKGFTYDDMKDVYHAMDCFFLTTSGEGWGIPTVEAMSCAVPVIATDYTSTKEIVEDNNAGLTIDTVTEMTGGWTVDRALCDIDVAVDCLEQLKIDPVLRKRLGRNGRTAAVTQFDWDEVVFPQWLETLEELKKW